MEGGRERGRVVEGEEDGRRKGWRWEEVRVKGGEKEERERVREVEARCETRRGEAKFVMRRVSLLFLPLLPFLPLFLPPSLSMYRIKPCKSRIFPNALATPFLRRPGECGGNEGPSRLKGDVMFVMFMLMEVWGVWGGWGGQKGRRKGIVKRMMKENN